MEVKLDDLSYEWVQKTEDVKVLQRAVKLIEEDGDYYFDLKKSILRKIDQKRGFSQNSTFEKKKEIEEINEWVQSKEVSDENKRKSEDLKVKGNEALKSGDWEEALNYY